MLGNLVITCDLEMAVNLSPNHKIICMSDNMNDYRDFVMATNANVLSVLLPPYDVSMLEIDNRLQEFDQAYSAYLFSAEPLAFIAVILRALVNKTNIVIFTTPDEYRMRFMSLFVHTLSAAFGINVMDNAAPSVFNTAYYPFILHTMFTNDTMSSDEFLAFYPEANLNSQQHQNTLLKLTNYYNPYGCNNLEESANYFNKLIYNRIHNNIQNSIIIPFRKG